MGFDVDSLNTEQLQACANELKRRQAGPRKRHIKKHWTLDHRGHPAPFTMREFEARVDKICGCAGRNDCDCVSVFNQAKSELWYEYNTRARAQQFNERDGL